MNKRQKTILVGMILGDAYLQKTGKTNARIRLEHGIKQSDYLVWKAQQFPEFFQGQPKTLIRYNPVFHKQYTYIRWQSNASPEIGKYQKIFYQQGKKIIPQDLSILLINRLSLAVWYMDDGYLYHRDKIAYIYLPQYSKEEIASLLLVLEKNFQLKPAIKTKKQSSLVLMFPVKETNKLLFLVKPYIIPSMAYKLLNPVSTEH